MLFIGFVASCDIPAGTEFAFDYNPKAAERALQKSKKGKRAESASSSQNDGARLFSFFKVPINYVEVVLPLRHKMSSVLSIQASGSQMGPPSTTPSLFSFCSSGSRKFDSGPGDIDSVVKGPPMSSVLSEFSMRSSSSRRFDSRDLKIMQLRHWELCLSQEELSLVRRHRSWHMHTSRACRNGWMSRIVERGRLVEDMVHVESRIHLLSS